MKSLAIKLAAELLGLDELPNPFESFDLMI